MTSSPPPNIQPIVDDQSGVVTSAWAEFFDEVFRGDAGTFWAPAIANITISGGIPIVTGRVYKLSQYLSLFVVTITPAQGGSISGAAGTCAITNYPLQMTNNGVCTAVSGNLGTTTGMCTKATNSIFPPTFSGVTVPITIIGIVEAS